VAEPYGRCVETQPHAGFGFSLNYYHFTYIICLANKYAPTVPAITILRLTLIRASQCSLVVESSVLLCLASSYVTLTVRTRCAKLIDIVDSRGF
jgi:hypothetical protein